MKWLKLDWKRSVLVSRILLEVFGVCFVLGYWSEMKLWLECFSVAVLAVLWYSIYMLIGSIAVTASHSQSEEV
jgi:hypothetical protein